VSGGSVKRLLRRDQGTPFSGGKYYDNIPTLSFKCLLYTSKYKIEDYETKAGVMMNVRLVEN